MTNDNVKTDREKRVEVQAQDVMEKLGADETTRPWYWKICWHLTEAQISNNLEKALAKGNDPQKYFSWLCKRDMA